MAIEKELLDQLLAGREPNEVFAKDGLLDDLKKALSERILNAELDVQTCIVHLIRNAMGFASWKDRKAIAQSLRSVYRAENAEAGLAALEAFEQGPWGQKYPAIAQSWRRHGEQVIPFFAFSEAIRRIIYTTNAIEALNSKLRRAVRTRGHFPGDDAAMKLLYLVLNHAAEEWKRPPREWFEAKTQFAVVFGERFVSQ